MEGNVADPKLKPQEAAVWFSRVHLQGVVLSDKRPVSQAAWLAKTTSSCVSVPEAGRPSSGTAQFLASRQLSPHCMLTQEGACLVFLEGH